MIHVAPEKQSHVITGIRLVVFRFLRLDECNIGILVTHHVGDPRSHHADYFAVVLFLETFHIAEPADRIADRPDRKLNHHFLAGRIVIMSEDRFFAAFLVDDQPETDEEFLDAGHISAGNRIVAEQDDSGIDVRERDMILLAVMRKQDSDSVIEVKLDPLHGIQSRNLRNLAVNARLFRRLRSGSRRRLHGVVSGRRSGSSHPDYQILIGGGSDRKIVIVHE